MKSEYKSNEEPINGPIAFRRWREQRGVSAVTAWRWTKNGWIDTINIAGKPYVTPEAIARFNARAAAGEFARPYHGVAAAGKEKCK